MQININVENNNKFSITDNQFLPADYTISVRIPQDINLAGFVLQTLQNALLSNGFSVSIGGDVIGK